MPRKKTTKSSRSTKQPPQDDGAVQDSGGVVKQASSLNQRSETTVSDETENEQDDIIEYDDDIDDAEPPVPIPVQTYPAQIRETESMTSGKGNKYIAVRFHISPDDYPADYPVENEPDGVSITYRRVSPENTPRARYGMKRFIEAIGAKGGKRINHKEWIGQDARIRVSHDSYEGVMRAQIDAVLPAE